MKKKILIIISVITIMILSLSIYANASVTQIEEGKNYIYNASGPTSEGNNYVESIVEFNYKGNAYNIDDRIMQNELNINVTRIVLYYDQNNLVSSVIISDIYSNAYYIIDNSEREYNGIINFSELNNLTDNEIIYNFLKSTLTEIIEPSTEMNDVYTDIQNSETDENGVPQSFLPFTMYTMNNIVNFIVENEVLVIFILGIVIISVAVSILYRVKNNTFRK